MYDEQGVPSAETLPAAQSGVYEDVPVIVKRLPDQGRYVFGVLLEGAFVAFADAKLGGIDDDIREAKQPGFKRDRAEAYRREQLGL